MKHPEADQFISNVLAGSDFQTAFSTLDCAFNALNYDRLERAFGLSTGKERFEGFLEVARRRHGELVDLIVPVLEEVQRQNNLIMRRGLITGNEHRFFLALLLNVPDRDRILELVRNRVPERNPVDTLVDWIEELANTKLAGSSEANVLGIEGIDEDYLFVLQCLFEGRSLEQTKDAFEEEFSGEGAWSLGDKLEKLYKDIRNSMLFKSIFLDQVPSVRATQSMAI
jgi:hypothetical protein